ncbi:MAG TPA: M57 family metalloprotease [Chitinophagaceae bacterium]|nr:M57 family metalloprotease [Chitinophagaceae bacterium]
MKNLIRSVRLVALLCTSALVANSQVPILNSYPSAGPTIYLDFDGQTVSGTSWNISGPIFCGPSGLTTAQITEVFNRVSEDYRPFTVNITTDSTKYWSAPANKRIRVIITVTSDWYGSAGGVAFVNSFTWGDNTPCFVFSALLNYNTKNISESSSHEAGHTLGLRHQSLYNSSCTKTAEYNPGTGSGEISWAPIMGVGYSRNLTTWYNGANSISCTTIQKDLDVITSSANGITYRSDYSSNAFNTAITENFVNNQFTASSILVKNTYQNVFKFTVPSLKLFQLSAVPFNVGSGNAGANLDLKVTLYNGSQTALNTYTSSSTLNVLIDTSLNTGTYYFKVEGTGNAYAPDYAIMGAYSVQGELIETPLALHKLDLRGTFDRDNYILNWTLQADETVTKQIIQISTDGKNFSELTEPGNADRSYSYRPTNITAALYRIYAELDNGGHYYSNIVAIRPSVNNYKPKLLNTLVTNGVITVSSPSVFDYSLLDLSGQILARGKVENGMNSINANGMIAGM